MTRIYGIETEYGLVARSDGRRLGPDEGARRLFVPLARARKSTNVFLVGGGRAYLDVGSHPEYATPECTSASDVVVAEQAGDAIMASLASAAVDAEASEGRATTFALFRNNVDPYGNTYGSHENYLVARDADPEHLAAWLVPFLVSRQLIAGAGRWARGRFTVSQRCEALADVVSNQTTRSRPLINTRDEPHADPSQHRRLHVISGDSNADEQTAWLKIVATELVLRAAEAGRTPPLALAYPLEALRAWGSDPDAAQPLIDGGSVTAREAQAAYLDAVGAFADEAETRRGVQLWEGVLAGRDQVEWQVKRALIEGYRDRHALADRDPRLDALDLRWHELGGGLARLLIERGDRPRIADPDAVAAARAEAPSASRARLRGRLVAAAEASDHEVAIDWASVTVHTLLGASLRLDDPFATADPRVDELIGRLRDEAPRRPLGGFVPPT